MTEQKDTRQEDYSIPPHMVLSSEEGLAERHFNLGREVKKGTDGVIIDRFELTPVLHLKLRYSPKKASE